MSEKLIQPSSSIGQFLARLEGDILTVTLPVAYVFVPGNPDVVPGFETSEYQWTDDQEQDFRRAFKKRVEEIWSSKFVLEDPDQKRRIEVRVVVEEVTLRDALWRIFVHRYPDDAVDTGASVCSPGQSHFRGACAGNPTGEPWGTVLLSSTHMRLENVRRLEVGPIDIAFKRNQIVPKDDFLNRAVTWLPRGGSEWLVQLTGFADLNELDLDGTETFEQQLQLAMSLARERTAHMVEAFANLKKEERVEASRIQVVNRGYTEDEDFLQKVSLAVYRTEPIDTLAHEAGHMLGLGDEVVIDHPASIDDPLPTPDYAAMVFWYAHELVRQHDDRGIMSRGGTVRRWHYSPFAEALDGTLTKSGIWRIVDQD